jgi:hypothetical protein
MHPGKMFRLRFPESKLKYWAARYPVEKDDAILRVAAAPRRRGYLTKREFLELGDWKTVRSRKNRRKNSEALVREATRIALATRNEDHKISVLRLLSGVGLPTASAILHLCDTGKYPLIDFRALWSLRIHKRTAPSIEEWIRYTQYVRGLARRSGCTMRQVDRALWQYSKERQRSS